MSPRRLALALPALLMLALSACMTTPNRDLDLERMESALTRLETDPELASKAPAEIARARETVRALNAATTDRDGGKVRHGDEAVAVKIGDGDVAQQVFLKAFDLVVAPDIAEHGDINVAGEVAKTIK